MKKKIAILVSLFFILVIWLAPVQLATGFIPKNGKLVVNGLQGSLWSGDVAQINFDSWQLKNIEYQLSFLTLLSMNVGGSAEIKGGDITGELDFQIADQSTAKIEDANLVLSAFHLEKYIPFPGVNLAGKLRTSNFSVEMFNQRPKSLSGTIGWNNATISAIGQNWNLGDFEVVWATEQKNERMIGTFVKTKNKLSIEGNIILTKSGKIEFVGSISTTTDRALYLALSIYANGKVSNGRLPIKYPR